ncbi:MAG: CBS domain-containing protein [archaeon]
MVNKELSPNEYFYFSGGKFLRSIEELMNSMQDMSLDLFRTHVDEHKNDFATWIRHVFHEAALANELQKLYTPIEFYILLKTFLLTNDLGIAKNELEKVLKKERKGFTVKQIWEFVNEEIEETKERLGIDEDASEELEEVTEPAPIIKKEKAPEVSHEEQEPEPKPQKPAEPEEDKKPQEPLPDLTEEERFEERINAYNIRLEELKKRISVCRRAGKDALIPDLMLRNVKSKIGLASVTQEEKDLQTIEEIFSRAEAEIKEVEESKPLNVKEEIDQMVHKSLKADKVIKQVKEVMVTDVITLPRNVPANMAAKVMADKGIGCVIIMEGERPLGIITERDIVRRAAQKQMNLEAITVSSIMTTPIITIDLNEDVLHASEIMKTKNFRRLVVTEGTRLVGLITQTDLLKEITWENRKIKGDS